jgi:hypothetical protein
VVIALRCVKGGKVCEGGAGGGGKGRYPGAPYLVGADWCDSSTRKKICRPVRRQCKICGCGWMCDCMCVLCVFALAVRACVRACVRGEGTL